MRSKKKKKRKKELEAHSSVFSYLHESNWIRVSNIHREILRLCWSNLPDKTGTSGILHSLCHAATGQSFFSPSRQDFWNTHNTRNALYFNPGCGRRPKHPNYFSVWLLFLVYLSLPSGISMYFLFCFWRKPKPKKWIKIFSFFLFLLLFSRSHPHSFFPFFPFFCFCL
jgi:hypothetical protein